MPGVVAVDLETVPLTNEPDFQDATDWEIFAIALAHRNEPGGNIEADVLIRERPGIEYEKRLLTEMCGWVERRDPGELITYNGESYDLPIIRERSTGRSESLINQTTHIDVYRHVLDRASETESCSLDAALDRHDLPNPDVEFEGEEITGEDMPRLARALWNGLVEGERREEVLKVVEWYAASDVEPLVRLHDKLTNYPGPG